MSVVPKKFTEYTANTTASFDDLFLVTKDPTGIPRTFSMSYTTLFANVSVTVNFANTVTVSGNNSLTVPTLHATYLTISNNATPASNTSVPASGAGTFWYDDNYLYIATSDTVVKRVPLASF